MNNINYNLKRHVELLKLKEKVLSQDKSFLKENEAEFLELSGYNAAVDQHIFWEKRFKVASLLQTFMNGKINAQDFHDSIFGLRRNHIDECNKFLSRLVSGEIKEFFPNKESYKLKGLLSALYSACEYFEMNWNEETFYDSIQNAFLKLQEILNEE